MAKTIKSIFLFDTSLISDLESVRKQIRQDNHQFAAIWSVVEFLYGVYGLLMSFWKQEYALCRYVYIGVIVLSVLAFTCSGSFMRKRPIAIYFAVLFLDISLFGSGLLIAWILRQNNTQTIMIFAVALIAPLLFVNSTLLNILQNTLYIGAAVLLLKHGLPHEDYMRLITNLVIFSSMGVTLGHFVNKTRFERYVFAESAAQLAEFNAKIAELQAKYAYYDQLTDLKNRRAYSEMIEHIESELPSEYCVIMVDCNGLKRVNDTLGHAAGDELIIGVAYCLRRSFDGIKTIFRLGGDEFCVILNDKEANVKKRLLQFERLCSEWKGKYANGISVSYGLASTEEFSDFDSVLQAADKRMYAFKSRYYETAAQKE